MITNNETKLAQLIDRARYLGRALANELQPESDAAPIRRELAQVNAEIDAIRAAAK